MPSQSNTIVLDLELLSELGLPLGLKDLVARLEAEVLRGNMTGWACAGHRYALSGFFADEVFLLGEGNCEQSETLHPKFDLASLTKPLFGGTCLRLLLEGHWNELVIPLVDLLASPQNQAAAIIQNCLREQSSSLTLLDLLNHRSGCPAWTWFGKAWWIFKDYPEGFCAKAPLDKSGAEARSAVIETLVNCIAPSLAASSASTVYSDLGYFLLAQICEHLALSRDSIQTTSVWQGLLKDLNTKLSTDFFHASLNADCTQSALPFYPFYVLQQGSDLPSGLIKERTFGSVHDTNANILARFGAVSFHAGLFGNILDVVKCVDFLAMNQKFLMETIPSDLTQRFVFGMDTARSLDSLAAPSPSDLGDEEHPTLFGHLGYTGTSFWFDARQPSRRNILLTNRTASRTRLGSVSVPRILVITDLATGQETFLETSSGSLKQVSYEDAQGTMRISSGISARIWNEHLLRDVPNINELRKQAGSQIWRV